MSRFFPVCKEKGEKLFEAPSERILGAYVLPICGLGLQYHAEYNYKISFYTRENYIKIIFSRIHLRLRFINKVVFFTN